jgi:hypothetical protein
MRMLNKLNADVRSKSPPDATGSLRRTLVCWTETIIFSIGAPIVVGLFQPDDPFLVAAKFPWIALVPLLIGLQYGFNPGLTSAILLIVGSLLNSYLFGLVPMSAVVGWALGCLVLGLVPGGLKDKWTSRIAELTKSYEERGIRLDRIERAYCVLNLSHSKLEERLAAERWSLQAAVENAGRLISASGEANLSEIGSILLDVFANQGMIQSGSIYLSLTPGVIPSVPTAVLGKTYPSAASHPLVQRALQISRLTSITGKSPGVLGNREVLAAVPLISSTKRCVGVLAVHDMPFMAFHSEHLINLALLAGRLADTIETSLPSLAALTTLTPEIGRYSNIQKTANVASTRPFAVNQ